MCTGSRDAPGASSGPRVVSAGCCGPSDPGGGSASGTGRTRITSTPGTPATTDGRGTGAATSGGVLTGVATGGVLVGATGGVLVGTTATGAGWRVLRSEALARP